MSINSNPDVLIIGGGIVGLATAYQIQQLTPNLKICVVDKESEVAKHQTGHNSGVLHSGIYYQPGSLKATNCRQGKLLMQQFCQEHEIPYEICGKVIVALDEQELPALEAKFTALHMIGCTPIAEGYLAPRHVFEGDIGCARGDVVRGAAACF